MVTIKNILVSDGSISADCYKEGQEEDYFSLVIDANTFDIRKCSLNFPSIYAGQAAAKLEQLSKPGPLPQEAISVWC